MDEATAPVKPTHKFPKWVRTLQTKGVTVAHWTQFQQGWPKAWNAQMDLTPLLDVLFHTCVEQDRAALGRIFAYHSFMESFAPLRRSYDCECHAYQVREWVQTGGTVDRDALKRTFKKELPEWLQQALTRLWEALQKLYKAPDDWVNYYPVIRGLVGLSTPWSSDEIYQTRDRVIGRMRGAYSMPRLT